MNVRRFVIFATVVAFSLLMSLPAQCKPPQSDLPVVKSADLPLYPNLARQARIEGTAICQVWTNGAAITRVQASGAHKLLMEAAEENLKTWRFYPHTPTSFTVTFVYSLDPSEVYGLVNPSLTLQLPLRVEIRTKSPHMETETSH